DEVRAREELEPRVDLLGDGRPAHDVATLQDEDLLAGLGQVGGVHQPVVTRSDDDGVVAFHQALLRSGLKKGSRATVAANDRRRRSTMRSIESAVPGTAAAGVTWASARYFFTVGDHVPHVA